MRKYSAIDLLRFKRFSDEHPDLKPMQQIKAYNEKYPELTPKQQLENIFAALDMNGEYKNLTGRDIPEEKNGIKMLNNILNYRI